MPIIKRYPNRKLYNTQEKRYITLDEIGEIIRDGEEAQVIDHASGEDITTLVLTQVILEQEKKKSGSFPHSVLSGLVRSGGDTLSLLQNTFLSSLRLNGLVNEEIRRRIDLLSKNGKVSADEGARWIEALCAQDEEAEAGSGNDEKILSRLMKSHGIPTRTQLTQLADELDKITRTVEEITRERNET